MTSVLNFNRSDSFETRWLEANDYVNSGRHDKALNVFESLAKEGYSEACVEIGNILERGGDGERVGLADA